MRGWRSTAMMAQACSLMSRSLPASMCLHCKSLTFGALFMDYDLDGLLDIFAANGHVADDISVLQPTLKYEEAPLMFRNKGNGKFEDVTGRLGPALRRAVVGRGAAYARLRPRRRSRSAAYHQQRSGASAAQR